MKTYARAANGVLLPLLAGLVALGWYASRAQLIQPMVDGAGIDAYLSLMSTGRFVTMAGFLVGGVLAVAATPWASLSVGLFLATVGMSLLGFADPDTVSMPFLVASFGRAMSTLGLWGALAKSLDGPRASLRDAAFVGVYTCVNLGAVWMTLGRDALLEVSPSTIHLVAAVMFGLAFMGALGLGVVAFVGREPTPAPQDAPKVPTPGPLALLVAGLFVLVAIPLSVGFDGYFLSYRIVEANWLNPAVVTVVGLMLGAAFLALHFTKVRFPTTLAIGIGLALWGFSIVFILFAVPSGEFGVDVDSSNKTLATVGMILGAVGEVMLVPLIYSRLSADLPFRLGNIVLALYLIAVQLPATIAGLLSDTGDFQRPFGWIGAVTAILFGLVIAGAAWPTRKFFWPPEEEAESPGSRPADTA